MQTVGSYEAKTRLPELLRSVEQGESITITRRGCPLPDSWGSMTALGRTPARSSDRMKRARAGRPSVSVKEILSARDQGRRP